MDENLLTSVAFFVSIVSMVLVIICRKHIAEEKSERRYKPKFFAPLVISVILALAVILLNIETGVSNVGLILSFALIGSSISQIVYTFAYHLYHTYRAKDDGSIGGREL